MADHDHGGGNTCHLGHVDNSFHPGAERQEGRDEPSSHPRLAGRGPEAGRPSLPEGAGPTRPLHCPLPAAVEPLGRPLFADPLAIVDWDSD